MLRRLDNSEAVRHPDLLIGIERRDDAGVYRIGPGQALVQTVDFFTPIVDEAFDWGRIAAANALSDVYAMGGRPLTALSIVGWPRDVLPFELLGDVLEGGSEVLVEAGCTLVGGHSVDDPEPKYGLAVTGLVDPDRVVSNQGARAGDALVLTKPIGSGVVATAIKRGEAEPAWRDAAVASMTTLNAAAATAMVAAGARAGTDVTGFGLTGHLHELLAGNGIGAEIEAAAVPLLPGAADLAAAGVVPGGTRRNLAASSGWFDRGDASEATAILLADAQTSGGLLVAVPEEAVAGLLAALPVDHPAAARIGTVIEDPGERVLVVS